MGERSGILTVIGSSERLGTLESCLVDVELIDELTCAPFSDVYE